MLIQISEPDRINKSMAYMYMIICGVLWLVQHIATQNAYHESPIIVNRMRGELVFFMFTKLSNISQHTAKAQELGKIIHLISNEFSSFDIKGYSLFILLVIPFGLAGVIIILVIRLGWPAFIILGVILAFFPLQFLVGEMNS